MPNVEIAGLGVARAVEITDSYLPKSATAAQNSSASKKALNCIVFSFSLSSFDKSEAPKKENVLVTNQYS